MKKITVALVPGHSFEDQNFTLFTGETEWSMGKRACEFIHDYWNKNFLNIESKLFHRKKEKSYSKEIKKVATAISDWNSSVDFVFEHHVNAFKKIALGCEGLFPANSKESARFTDLMTDAFSASFMVKERHKWKFENGYVGDGMKPLTKNSRGASPIYYMKYGAKMSMLWEPCFGNLKHGESMRVFEDDIAYFKWLAIWMGKQLGGILKEEQTKVEVPSRPEPQEPTLIPVPKKSKKKKSFWNFIKDFFR